MTSATVAKTAKTGVQAQAKPEKIRRDHKVNWWLTAVVTVLSLTVLVPLYFAVVTALKTPGEAGTFSLPTTWEWHNFADAWNKVNYPKAALNSAIITVCAVVLTLLTNTFVAYAVARNMDKRFFRFLYYFFLAMMFVPFTVIMLPIAKEMGTLHLDNQLGLIILYTILGIGTNLFIASGFIRSIPISLEEAARIDGASTWRIFWTIIFPLMGPINATIAILTALWAWNDFLLPLITLTDQSNQTIPLAQYVFQSQFTSNYPMAFASYLMAMAPVLIVYIFAQNPVPQIRRNRAGKTSLWQDFASIFGRTIANFIMVIPYILAFFAVFKISGGDMADHTFGGFMRSLFVIAGFFGGAVAWWTLLAFVINLVRRRFRPRHMLTINHVAGLIIGILGIYTILSTFFDIFPNVGH